MSEIAGIVAAIIVVVVMEGLAFKLARAKGRDAVVWLVLTLAFGIFALIALLLLPKHRRTAPEAFRNPEPPA
jgi:steroid 5-alpha reductase family enzyme